MHETCIGRDCEWSKKTAVKAHRRDAPGWVWGRNRNWKGMERRENWLNCCWLLMTASIPLIPCSWTLVLCRTSRQHCCSCYRSCNSVLMTNGWMTINCFLNNQQINIKQKIQNIIGFSIKWGISRDTTQAVSERERQRDGCEMIQIQNPSMRRRVLHRGPYGWLHHVAIMIIWINNKETNKDQ